MLVAEHLVRRYGDFTAVDDVSFEISKGSCFGLLGPNGAGKTSTIGMLCGLVTADKGNVTIDGQLMSPNAFAVKRRVGYVPQELALYDTLSATDNLSFFGGLYGLDGAKMKQRIGFALTLSGLADRAKEPVSKYSGGMKRRLNIAASLMAEPDVLILDEPTVGIDPQSRNAIFEVLQALQADGMTLLYTTHYMEEVERLCDRIAVIDQGKVIANDKLEGLYRMLPSSSVLEVETATDDCAQRLAKDLAERGLDARPKGANVDISHPSMAEAMAAAAKSAADLKVEILNVQSAKVTLEEVFLHLTGKSLRD